MKPARKNAFTLIELLVVIAIVGVLAAVVLVAINPARRLGQARDSGRKSDIGQLATALQAYFTSNPNASYPTSTEGLQTIVNSGDLKQLPTQPGGADYGYDSSPDGCDNTSGGTPCDEAVVFAALEEPNDTACASTVYWVWRSSTGQAGEECLATLPTAP